jgi:hypothetical protein
MTLRQSFFGGKEAPKGRCMKSDPTDFIGKNKSDRGGTGHGRLCEL